jgi:hypothetical protein
MHVADLAHQSANPGFGDERVSEYANPHDRIGLRPAPNRTSATATTRWPSARLGRLAGPPEGHDDPGLPTHRAPAVPNGHDRTLSFVAAVG